MKIKILIILSIFILSCNTKVETPIVPKVPDKPVVVQPVKVPEVKPVAKKVPAKPQVKLNTKDRCNEFKTDVRIEHTKYFGSGYPWQYGLGQLRQESSCRADSTAFDLGQGVAQFMPKTSEYIQSLMGEKLNPYNPQSAIRMQAFYMYRIHTKENWTDKLWISYQIYNSGRTVLYNEYKRAGVLDWSKMKNNCKRKIVKLPNGNLLDFCQSGYDYSQKIYKYGNQYNPLPSSSFKYW